MAVRHRALIEGVIARARLQVPGARRPSWRFLQCRWHSCSKCSPCGATRSSIRPLRPRAAQVATAALAAGSSTRSSAIFCGCRTAQLLRYPAEGRGRSSTTRRCGGSPLMRAAYPADWRELLDASCQLNASARAAGQPTAHGCRRRPYLQRLTDKLGVGCDARRPRMRSGSISRGRWPLIPGFAAGEVSVQDAGAQLAAPNGSTCVTACGSWTPAPRRAARRRTSPNWRRLNSRRSRRTPHGPRRIRENLDRIGRHAQILVADARNTSAWWDGTPFDRILLDAPCTGSGVVRRHPDIPWLRRKADVAHLATLQRQLLDALWPLLGVGGRLLYVVCSVFPEEGREQVEHVVARLPGATVVPLPGGSPTVRLLPVAAGFRGLGGRATMANAS